MQGSFVALEELQHFFAVGRRDDVRDERFGAELANADLAAAEASGCFGGTTKTSSSRKTTMECKTGFLGFVGEHAEFNVVAQDVVGDVAAESAFDD